MKVAYRMFLVLMIFCVAMVPLYAVWQQRDFGGVPELAGLVALVMTGLMMALAGWYLWVTAKKFTGAPDDNPDAEIADGEGDYGFFTPYSWWPLWLGLSCAILFAGLAVGWWLFMIGVVIGAISVVGWTFEHFRGVHAN